SFVASDGADGTVTMVGAFNDLFFEGNTLTAFSGPNATGDVLGSVSATGAGDFFGLSSTVGIGSITFSGPSTEIDDLVFSPVSSGSPPTDPIKISFDDLPAMSHITDSAVPPTDVRLSDHFL